MCCTDKTSTNTNENENEQGNFQSLSLLNPIITPSAAGPMWLNVTERPMQEPYSDDWEGLFCGHLNPAFLGDEVFFFKLPVRGVYSIFIQLRCNTVPLFPPFVGGFYHLRLRDTDFNEYTQITVPLAGYEFFSTTILVNNTLASRQYTFEMFQTLQFQSFFQARVKKIIIVSHLQY